MTANQLIAWQKRMGFNNAEAAQALGVCRATYYDYRRGISRNTGRAITPPRTIALACAALEEGINVK